MNRKMIMGLVLVIALFVSACGSSEQGKGEENRSELSGIQATESIMVDMESADILLFSGEVQKEIESKGTKAGSYLFRYDGKIYLAVFAGERNTGGYGIDIIEVIADGMELKVSVELTEPGEDMMVFQALTYPMDLVELKNIKEIEGLTVSVEVEAVIVLTEE